MIVNPLLKRRRPGLKWVLLIVAVVLATLATVAIAFFMQPELPLRDAMFDDHAAKRQQIMLEQDSATGAGAIVLLGDSHLELMDNDQRWPGSLNLGIRGDTSAAVLDRMDSYQSLATARVVIISLGANDIAQGYRINQTVANVRDIVSRLPAQTPVLLTAIHAMDERVGLVGYNRNIRRWNEAYMEAFAQSDRIHLVASPHAPENDADNLAIAMHIGDGIHLSQAGYDAWISVLKPAVDSVIDARSTN
ncbi:GDSL-type esterase/lipase family protein [Saccharospirillum impatiens]|uniref:GDSL-type esterase/lipase family protein n=1 Tax=Saccharospirillum impatiens TaxID=169438 RepID=UPI0004921A60|nr:GDSL-type esterase/lipase family protein [Saccharospirillum impatiens]